MPWFFYALLNPILYSVTNYIEKFLVDKRIREPVSVLGIKFFAISVMFLGLLFI